MIDKLDASLQKTASRKSLEKRALLKGLTTKTKRKDDRAEWLVVSDKNGKEACFRLNKKKTSTYFVSTNPSQFSSAHEYTAFIKKILTPTQIAKSRISRLDFAVDINEELEKIIGGLEIKQRKASTIHTDQMSGQTTGLYFGKGKKQIAVYDKGKEIQKRKRIEVPPTTRIEVRLKGAKNLPVKSLANLADLGAPKTQEKLSDRHFGNITLNDLSLKDEISLKKSAQLLTIRSFIDSAKDRSYTIARKRFDKNNNFDRDIKKHINLIPREEQPQQLIIDSLKSFFEQPQKHHKKRKPAVINTGNENKTTITMSEAASILNVHRDTLRNWANKGKVTSHRHPLNGYRMFDRRDIELLKNEINKAK